MTIELNRRRFLKNAAAAIPGCAIAFGTEPGFAQAAAAPVEVNARRIENFDPRDPGHLRYGSLEFRSGLILTSPFRGFGGLSAFRLDKKGQQFIPLRDKANWFTGRLVYQGKRLAGLADVKSAPMLDSNGRNITARGWFDTESLAFDGAAAYVG